MRGSIDSHMCVTRHCACSVAPDADGVHCGMHCSLAHGLRHEANTKAGELHANHTITSELQASALRLCFACLRKRTMITVLAVLLTSTS